MKAFRPCTYTHDHEKTDTHMYIVIQSLKKMDKRKYTLKKYTLKKMDKKQQ